jgi:hypothetical protein
MYRGEIDKEGDEFECHGRNSTRELIEGRGGRLRLSDGRNFSEKKAREVWVNGRRKSSAQGDVEKGSVRC